MEQKKTLWIIAATGVFLLVVIGAAMILYSPSNREVPAVASALPSRPSDHGWVAQKNPLNQDMQKQGEQTPATPEQPPEAKTADTTNPSHVNEMTVIAGTTNVYGIKTNTPDDHTTTIDLNTLKTASVPAVPPRTKDTGTEALEPSSVVSTNNNVQKIAEEPVHITKPVSPVKKTVSAPTERKAVPAQVKPKAKKATPLAPKYWVQAASFTSKTTADESRSILDKNRIPSEVFTYKDTKGRIFYRVRIGPYTTKSEAEYWQNRIVSIDEFKNTQSYITNSSARAK